jgi:hypothetical protein
MDMGKNGLEDMLKAEAYFYSASNNKTDTPNYTDFAKNVDFVVFAYQKLNENPDAGKILGNAKRKDMIRQKRENVPNQVVPVKAEIETGSADAQIEFLKKVASNPELFKKAYPLLESYSFEIAYKVLRAYNTMVELKEGTCVPAGSTQCLADRVTREVVNDQTGEKTGTYV